MTIRSAHAVLFALIFRMSTSAFGQDYLRYYRLCDSAELAILSEDYPSAVRYYNTVYDAYPFIFASDCYKATQAAVLAQDSIVALKFLRKCMIQGIEKKYLLVSPLITRLSVCAQWHTVLSEYDSLRKIYLGNIDRSLRERIIPIYEKEQFYNELRDNSGIFSAIPRLIRYRKVNRECVDSILHIMRTIGHFPGERVIGVIDSSMYDFDRQTQLFYDASKGRPYLNTHEYLIFVHYYQVHGKVNYDKLLLEAVKTGHLHPRKFALISDNRIKKKAPDFYMPRYKMYRKLKKSAVSESTKEQLAAAMKNNREAIGMRSAEADVLIKKRYAEQEKQWAAGNFNLIFLE